MVGRVTPGAELFVAAVVVLWAWLVTHFVLLARIVRTTQATSRDRWLALVPVLTPWVAWRHDKRWHVIAWACLFVLYVAVRVGLAAR